MTVHVVLRDITVSLRTSVLTARGQVRNRPGVVVDIHDDAGNVGRGEVAPLPGWSSVDVRTARRELQTWQATTQSAGEATVPQAASSDTRAAIDTALWDLRAQQARRSLWQMISGKRAEPAAALVPVNQLVGGATPAALAEAAAEAQALGFTTLKAKLGLPDDLDRLAALAEVVEPSSRLRLDANATWGLAEAIDMSTAAVGQLGDRLEYLEDPVASLADLRELRAAVSVEIAVDELVRSEADLQRVIAGRLAGVLVVKPALLGGISPVVALASQADGAGLGVVVSSIYDGAVGLRAWCHLAAAIGPHRAHGLGTGDLLVAPEARPLAPIRGHVRLEAWG